MKKSLRACLLILSFSFFLSGEVAAKTPSISFQHERNGTVFLLRNDQPQPGPLAGVPAVITRGEEAGLIDVEPHPNFKENGLVYFSYIVDENGLRLRVSRHKFSGAGFSEPDIIFPGLSGPVEAKDFGGEMKFGNDGKLYLSVGARLDRARAEDKSDPHGKTLRLNDDGSVPRDNPFIGDGGVRSDIFSFSSSEVIQ